MPFCPCFGLQRATRLQAVAVVCLFLAVAGSLLLALQSTGLPGCSQGNAGCGAVLSSRFSSVLGVPVSMLGVLLYTCTILTLRARRFLPMRFTASVLACACLAGAGWFYYMQLGILQAVCVYCSAVHAAAIGGAAIGLLLLWRERAGSGRSVLARGVAAAVGVGLVAGLAGVQLAQPVESEQVLVVRESENTDTGPGPDRAVTFLGGAVKLRPHDYPVVGSPDAPHVLLLLTDYRCPMCRELSGTLARRDMPGFSVVVLPVPLEADCNPNATSTAAHLDGGCDLARLAVAVWLAEPGAFEAFHEYLAAQPPGYPVPAARARAEQMVGEASLRQALDSDAAGDLLNRARSLHGLIGTGSVPVLIAGNTMIVGAPDDPNRLNELLADALGESP